MNTYDLYPKIRLDKLILYQENQKSLVWIQLEWQIEQACFVIFWS